MSDGLPSDEQLRRIERGVRRRIERRGRVARQVAGASAAVLVVAGGIALLAPIARTAGSASSAGGSGDGAQAPGVVVCHDGARTTRAEVPAGALPGGARAACARALRALPEAASGSDGRPSPSPSPSAALCETARGVLHVYLDGSACGAHGMTQRP